MTTHQRAVELMLRARAANLNRQDHSWLQEHLRECPECARMDDSFDSLTVALKSQPVVAPPALVMRTRALVRTRAAELRESRGEWLFKVAVVQAVFWTVLAGFYLWQGLPWISAQTGIPLILAGSVVLSLWSLPIVAAFGIAYATRQNGNPTQLPTALIRTR